VQAQTGDGQTADDPSDETLFDLLAALGGPDPFLVVERLDLEPAGQHYMQVYLNDDGSCDVEFREGGPDRHFAARVSGPFAFGGHQTVARVLCDWASRRPGWREALDWQPLEL
jgi:hypothetical protein